MYQTSNPEPVPAV